MQQPIQEGKGGLVMPIDDVQNPIPEYNGEFDDIVIYASLDDLLAMEANPEYIEYRQGLNRQPAAEPIQEPCAPELVVPAWVEVPVASAPPVGISMDMKLKGIAPTTSTVLPPSGNNFPGQKNRNVLQGYEAGHRGSCHTQNASACSLQIPFTPPPQADASMDVNSGGRFQGCKQSNLGSAIPEHPVTLPGVTDYELSCLACVKGRTAGGSTEAGLKRGRPDIYVPEQIQASARRVQKSKRKVCYLGADISASAPGKPPKVPKKNAAPIEQEGLDIGNGLPVLQISTPGGKHTGYGLRYGGEHVSAATDRVIQNSDVDNLERFLQEDVDPMFAEMNLDNVKRMMESFCVQEDVQMKNSMDRGMDFSPDSYKISNDLPLVVFETPIRGFDVHGDPKVPKYPERLPKGFGPIKSKTGVNKVRQVRLNPAAAGEAAGLKKQAWDLNLAGKGKERM